MVLASMSSVHPVHCPAFTASVIPVMVFQLQLLLTGITLFTADPNPAKIFLNNSTIFTFVHIVFLLSFIVSL